MPYSDVYLPSVVPASLPSYTPRLTRPEIPNLVIKQRAEQARKVVLQQVYKGAFLIEKKKVVYKMIKIVTKPTSTAYLNP